MARHKANVKVSIFCSIFYEKRTRECIECKNKFFYYYGPYVRILAPPPQKKMEIQFLYAQVPSKSAYIGKFRMQNMTLLTFKNEKGPLCRILYFNERTKNSFLKKN